MLFESSNADDDETVELVDLLSSSMLFKIESSDDHPSLTFPVIATFAVAVSVVDGVVVDVVVVSVAVAVNDAEVADVSLVFSLHAFDLGCDEDLLAGSFARQLLMFVIHFVLLENDCRGMETWKRCGVRS